MQEGKPITKMTLHFRHFGAWWNMIKFNENYGTSRSPIEMALMKFWGRNSDYCISCDILFQEFTSLNNWESIWVSGSNRYSSFIKISASCQLRFDLRHCQAVKGWNAWMLDDVWVKLWDKPPFCFVSEDDLITFVPQRTSSETDGLLWFRSGAGARSTRRNTWNSLVQWVRVLRWGG